MVYTERLFKEIILGGLLCIPGINARDIIINTNNAQQTQIILPISEVTPKAAQELAQAVNIYLKQPSDPAATSQANTVTIPMGIEVLVSREKDLTQEDRTSFKRQVSLWNWSPETASRDLYG